MDDMREVKYEGEIYYVLSEIREDRIDLSIFESDEEIEHWDLILDPKFGWLGHVTSRMEGEWPNERSHEVIEAAYPELKGASVHRGSGTVSISKEAAEKHNLGAPLREYIVEPEVSPIPKRK